MVSYKIALEFMLVINCVPVTFASKDRL